MSDNGSKSPGQPVKVTVAKLKKIDKKNAPLPRILCHLCNVPSFQSTKDAALHFAKAGHKIDIKARHKVMIKIFINKGGI